MRLVILTITVALLALAGQARADDGKASAFLARIGQSTVQTAQAAGCANACQLAGSVGGATCEIPQGTGCVPVGTGCTCPGQIINSMGRVSGHAVRN